MHQRGHRGRGHKNQDSVTGHMSENVKILAVLKFQVDLQENKQIKARNHHQITKEGASKQQRLREAITRL